jgi:diguanylate cyclase (GGDEF)-like protein/PAS domain S-box-containing protein
MTEEQMAMQDLETEEGIGPQSGEQTILAPVISRFGIGIRLLLWILLFSFLFALLASVAQLYFEYRREVSVVAMRLDEVGRSTRGSLSEGVWNLDAEQIHQQLEGLLLLPDLQEAEVRGAGLPKTISVSKGPSPLQRKLAKDFVLSYQAEGVRQVLGVLHLEATLANVYSDIQRQALNILLVEGLRTFAFAFFILFFFHWLVTRHLIAFAAFLQRFDARLEPPQFVLQRKPLAHRDELDQVVGSFNETSSKLYTVNCELAGANAVLEEDIQARKQAEEKLAEAMAALQTSEARYRTAFQTSPDGVVITSLEDGSVIDINQGFIRILGYQPEDVIGRNLSKARHWVDPEKRVEFFESLRRNKALRDFEARFYHKTGEIVWGQLSASLIDLNGVSCVLIIFRDITAAKTAEERIRSLSLYDALTNLPNRRSLMERLGKALTGANNSQRKKALLFVDLDHFKPLNDKLGSPVGDLLLQQVARRLRGCVHDSDAVTRFGGDEFLVLLEDLSEVAEDAAARAEDVAKRILVALGQPYTVDLFNCSCTASIGITVFDDRHSGADEVLSQADFAMGQAKAAGRNVVRFFSKPLQAAVNARAALVADLRLAVDYGEFQLYYQPQVDGSRLTGAEALIRWNHAKRGLVSPGTFIPLAEETGLILPIGDWVLETACRQIAAWVERKQMKALTISVNVSAKQFHEHDFVPKVLRTLERTGADPIHLELEVTESILVENVEAVISKMTELKTHGIRFSLDDFGTGYSSLSYLKRLPLNKLKIDISFVRDILVDANSGTIAQTVIALGRAMGLLVIAEGVEFEEQREFLANLGCSSYQGYLFSRPLAGEDFELLLPDCLGKSLG